MIHVDQLCITSHSTFWQTDIHYGTADAKLYKTSARRFEEDIIPLQFFICVNVHLCDIFITTKLIHLSMQLVFNYLKY